MKKSREREVLDHFTFDANAWLTSPAVSAMTPAQEGAFIRLLALQAKTKDCTLPNDDAELAAMSRLKDQWPELGPLVRKQFVVSKRNSKRIFNEVLRDKWRAAWSKYRAACKRNKENRLKRAPVVNDSSTTGQPVEPIKRKRKRVIKETTPYPLLALADQAWAHWKATYPDSDWEFGADRRRKVLQRLSDGTTLEKLKAAIDGNRASAWHQEKGLIDLKWICHSASRVDQFAARVPRVKAPEVPEAEMPWERARREATEPTS